MTTCTGPLAGVRILEFAGIGPAPFGAIVLAGLGADIIRVHRPGDPGPVDAAGVDADKQGRASLVADLKDPASRELVLALVARADAVIEGFRPGVMERLGYGPQDLLACNPRLVYARMTGFGQEGPLSGDAGHDINYLAIAGVLDLIGREHGPPVPPLNLVADGGGGGMLLALGLVCGVLEARGSGRGQVVDAAMVDGSALLARMFFSLAGSGAWGPRGTNVVDSGAPFYDVYATADDGYMAVGAIEPQFYAELLRVLGVPPSEAPQWDREAWPGTKARFAEVFATAGRAEWTARFAGVQACVTPVLRVDEVADHPHHRARGTFREHAGVALPGPAPRFSRTPNPDLTIPRDAERALAEWGVRPASKPSPTR